ncbi:hypothetical protein HMPREF1550_02179, partial [Actinomyces sp. oral taxon 877 str. F0543]
PAYALVAGVPARRIGWVGEAGEPLVPGAEPGRFTCPATGRGYRLDGAGALAPEGEGE